MVKNRRPARSGEIDLMKFIFSLIIAAFHSDLFYPQKTYAKFGYLGCELFFMVTGYFMARSAEKADRTAPLGESAIKFISHKIKLTLPAYLTAVAYDAALLICTGVLQIAEVNDPARWMSDLFFLQMDGYPCYSFTGTMWYLSAMFMACFLLWPLLIKATELFENIIAPVGAVLIYGYILMTNSGSLNGPDGWNGFMYLGLLRALAGIALGTFIYSISKELTAKKMSYKGELAVTAVQVVLFLLTAAIFIFSYPMNNDAGLVILFVPLVILTTCGHDLLAKHFDHGFFTYLGKLSLFIFLTHYPLATVIKTYRDKFETFLTKSTGSCSDIRLLLLFLLTELAAAVLLMLLFDAARAFVRHLKASASVKKGGADDVR